jgi:hypothetical protein
MSETRYLSSVNGDSADNVKFVNASDWDLTSTGANATSVLWLYPEDFGKTIVLNEPPPINPANLGSSTWFNKFWIMFTGVYQEDPTAEAIWGGDFGEILIGKQYMELPEGSQIRIVKGYPDTDPVETVSPARDADFQQLRLTTDYYIEPFSGRQYYPGDWATYESYWITQSPTSTLKYKDWYNCSVGNSPTTGLSWGDSIVITKLGNIHFDDTNGKDIYFVMNADVHAENPDIY